MWSRVYEVLCAILFSSFIHVETASITGHVITSSPINITEIPWQVSVEYNAAHRCSGALIALDWVVTTAHCTSGMYTQNLEIRAGGSVWFAEDAQVANVSGIYIHPDYDSNTIDYDISIIQLSAPLTEDASVSPIQLPASGTSWPVGTSGTITTWTSFPNSLKSITVSIISQDDCIAAYSTLHDVTDRMLCTSISEEGSDICQGDIASPLVVNGTLAGLISWSFGCSRGYPDVYTNVSSVRDYIEEIAGI